ncbi:MAG: hypothetical protein NVSMB27_44600 [Ktedonobacteraceae bacterium]
MQSIFVEPEDVYIFGGTGCIGEEEHVCAPYQKDTNRLLESAVF